MHEIKAVLAPPFTHYSIGAITSDLSPIQYSWSISGNGRCAGFAGSGASAQWNHDDDERCPHEAAAHPGTISVTIKTAWVTLSKTYSGGSAPHDPGPVPWLNTEGVGGFVGGNQSGDDPRDHPPPAIFGEELECPGDAKGSFEPAQVVWQDETPDNFADVPTKQLTKENDRRYHAELDLVVGKHTQLFGIRGSRDKVRYEVELGGAQNAASVVRWTLEDANGGRHVLGEKDVGYLPILGACREPKRFTLDSDATMGLGIRHFIPTVEGPYTITMEVARKGGPRVPGTQVVVYGDAREVVLPPVYFMGAIVTDRPGATPQELVSRARAMAAESEANIPDYFPLKPGAFDAVVRPVERDLREAVRKGFEICGDQVIGRYDWCSVDAARTAIESMLSAGTWQLGTGANGASTPGRVIVVISPNDLYSLYASPNRTILGFAASDKTAFLQTTEGHFSIAHEIAHTVPKAFWLHPQTECGVDFHNKNGTWGNGFQLSKGSAAVRVPQPERGGLMSAGPDGRWIEQCTYWNLVENIPTMKDPTLVGIRAWLAKNGSVEAGGFFRGMTFDGMVDPTPGEGRFAMVLRDSGGNVAAEHRFDHPFADSWGTERPLVSITMAVERPLDLASIELTGESGILATLPVSANAPSLSILAPAAQASWSASAPVDVRWEATDADGDAITYGVAMSPDDGATWHDVAFDAVNASLTIPSAFFTDAWAPRVRVTATDGVNSDTREVHLEARAPPLAPPTFELPIGTFAPTGEGDRFPPDLLPASVEVETGSASPSPTIATSPSSSAAGDASEGDADAPGPGLALVLAAIALTLLLRRR